MRNDPAYPRDPHDWYVEPTRATVTLLTRETFPGWTHDPCCGRGNIVETMGAHACMVTGSDLVQRVSAPWFVGCGDFLEHPRTYAGLADNIVFNPPFYRATGAETAIRNALATVRGKVAAFVNIRFLMSGGRARGLWRDHPANVTYLLSDRPSCPPGHLYDPEVEASGGTDDFCWVVWHAAPDRLPPGARGYLEMLTL